MRRWVGGSYQAVHPTLEDENMTDGSCPAELGAKIESNIRALLVGEPFLYKTQDTKQVKLRLHELGRSLGFTVLASGFPADRTNWKAGPEWLYDMVWVAYETEPTTPPQKMVVHFLTRQAMVMECEMRQGRPSRKDRDVDEDFQKLVQARADVRVWITRVGTRESAEEHIENCKKQIKAFPDTLPCDQYLLVILVGAPLGDFVVESYPHLSSNGARPDVRLR
jgi:hypothetical protein